MVSFPFMVFLWPVCPFKMANGSCSPKLWFWVLNPVKSYFLEKSNGRNIRLEIQNPGILTFFVPILCFPCLKKIICGRALILLHTTLSVQEIYNKFLRNQKIRLRYYTGSNYQSFKNNILLNQKPDISSISFLKSSMIYQPVMTIKTLINNIHYGIRYLSSICIS